jgi:hypothetical protein
MDYTRSALIRSKSISELMFEQDRTFREAVSDKFKARAMGFKEKFTPMNFVRMLTGSGTIGRSIRTVAGRAMGYTERDIERFGGYKRKRSIYGPDRSRVPAGARTPAKVGDSTADILAKIYNLMRKIDEDNTRRYEEENNFTEENQFESKKRHGKLLEALGMKKKDAATPKTYAPEKPKEQEDESGGMLGKIFSSIFGVFGKTFKMLASLGGIIVAAVTGLFGMIKSLMGMAKSIISTVMELVANLIKPLIESIFKAIVKLVTEILPQFATKLMEVLSDVSNTLSDLIESSDMNNSTKAKLKSRLSKVGMSGLLSDMMQPNLIEKFNPLYIGKEASDLYIKSEQQMESADYKYGKNPGEFLKKYKKEQLAEPGGYNDTRALAEQLASDYKVTLMQNLENMGYKLESYDKNGIPIMKNSAGKMPTPGDLISASIDTNSILNNESYTKGIISKLDPRNSEIYHQALDKIHDETNRMTSVGEQFKTMLNKVINIPTQMADEGASYIKDALAQAGDFISHITGPTEQTIAMPTIRNTEKTFQDRIRAITYVV